MINAQLLCPRCDEGPIVLQRVIATDEVIAICMECEAVWPAGAEIILAEFTPFDRFMRARGLSDLWRVELDDQVLQ